MFSAPLLFAAKYGRWILIIGLLAGTLLPSLAALLRPHIAWMIVALLLTSCIRIGHKQAVAAFSEIQAHIGLALILQMAVPLFFTAIFYSAGLSGPLCVALLVMGMAAPLAGSPNLMMMIGANPAPALRQLVIGTALLPVTCLPVLFFVPGIGDVSNVAYSALRLLIIILGAAIVGFTIRATILKNVSDKGLIQVDGASAILMGVVVVGLMAAVGDYFYNQPITLVGMLLFVCLANFGSQILFGMLVSRTKFRPLATMTGIAAGNRNIALFLAALPTAATDPILLFIGCYQIPMYLTPMIMERFYKRLSQHQSDMKSGA